MYTHIHFVSEQNSAISGLANPIDVKCESNYNDKSCSRREDLLATIVNSNNIGMQLMPANEENMSALEEHYYRNHASSQTGTNPKRGDTKVCNNAESISANEDVLLAFEDHYRNGIVSQRRGNSDSWRARVVCDNRRNTAEDTWGGVITSSKEVGQSGTGHRDGLTDKALSVPNGGRLSRRGRAETSAGGARSGGGAGARNTDAAAPLKRIREKRDNNPYRRKHDKAEDKDRRDRRSAQRDVQERASGSRIASGKRDGDTRSAEKTADERGNPNGRSSYRRGEEHGTRSSDNGGERRRIGGRLDRAEEESTSTGLISADSGKRDENGERDRHVNEEKPVARGNGAGLEDKDGEITTPLSESEESRRGGGKRDSSDESAEDRRSVVNKEGQFRAVDEIRRSTPTGRGYDSNEASELMSIFRLY